MQSICMYDGENLTTELRELAQQILDQKVTIEFEIDYSGCYYESDSPSYRLLIKDKNE
jgi:hypothetical protein